MIQNLKKFQKHMKYFVQNNRRRLPYDYNYTNNINFFITLIHQFMKPDDLFKQIFQNSI